MFTVNRWSDPPIFLTPDEKATVDECINWMKHKDVFVPEDEVENLVTSGVQDSPVVSGVDHYVPTVPLDDVEALGAVFPASMLWGSNQTEHHAEFQLNVDGEVLAEVVDGDLIFYLHGKKISLEKFIKDYEDLEKRIDTIERSLQETNRFEDLDI